MIEPVGGHGGMDYYDFGLCAGLGAAGVDVVLQTCDETVIPDCAGFVVRHTYHGIFGKTSAWRRGLRFVSGSLRAVVFAVLEERKVIHLHLFHVGALPFMNVLLARLMARKLVITAHDVESFVTSLEVPLISRMAYRLAHRVIAHNNISRDELKARLHVPVDKIAVIPHGNYLHALRPMPPVDIARAKLGIPANAKVLLFFGQIKDVKGLDLLLKAMPLVLQRHPNAVLLIAGKPWKTDFAAYQAKIDELGINHACITNIRFIPDEEVSLYYGAADLVVLPYLRIYQSGVVLMAMSYEKAVLVSDIPGMLEVVNDQETGFVFHSGNVDDLVQKICTIFTNQLAMESVAKRGYSLMKDKYDWAVIGNKTKDLYASLY